MSHLDLLLYLLDLDLQKGSANTHPPPALLRPLLHFVFNRSVPPKRWWRPVGRQCIEAWKAAWNHWE